MSEFIRLQNAEKFYKVKIQQQEKMLQDLQVERQAMYQVIGAMIVNNEELQADLQHAQAAGEYPISGVTLNVEDIGRNYDITRVDDVVDGYFTYRATIKPGE